MTAFRVENETPAAILAALANLGERPPDIGTLFVWHDTKFAVTGWARRADPRQGHQTSLMFCRRSDAEYVTGSGACGCVAPLDEITVAGVAGWSPAVFGYRRDLAQRLVGHGIV